jgi:TonB-dependent SusC/RagA subfamily outer membrane receptor
MTKLRPKKNHLYNIYMVLLATTMWLLPQSAHASNLQSILIKGQVFEAGTENPIPGANIIEKGTTNGTIADFDGKFSLTVSSENAILQVSYLQYINYFVTVGSERIFKIFIKPSNSELDEVVIIGYGTSKKTDVTGSVSSIKASSFNGGVIESPEQLLQGKISGVRVTSSSGEPGATNTVTIRGAGALRSGDSPLYVIDGVPISSESTSPAGGNLVGSVIPTTAGATNPLSFLNPSDIASLDILKDASATAIYGSRGANGVILITTKKGKAGQSTIDFNTYVSFSSIANKLDVGKAIDFGSVTTVDTDWQDQIFRSTITKNNYLSYGAGGERSSFRVSLGVLDQDGIINRSGLKRYTGRINSSFSALENNKLKFDFNLTASQTQNFSVPRADAADTRGELITNTLSALPSRPVFDASGNYSSGITNPIGLLESTNDETLTNRVLGNLTTTYKLAKNLIYQLNLGADLSIGKREQELIPNNLEGVSNNGVYSVGDVRASNLLFENFLTYDLKREKNRFNFLLGYANQTFSSESNNSLYSGFVLPSVSAIDNPANAPFLTGLPMGSNNTTILESVFARVNYSFGERFDMTVSIRADGTSKFAEGNKWGVFPALAGSYDLIDAVDSSVINNVKARIGWGQTGNQSVPGNPTKDTFRYVRLSSSEVGITKVAEGNPDLEWEISNQLNFGLDFSLFKKRLNGNIDYFKKINKKLILFVASEPPAVSGQWINLPGDITNSGVEVSLGYKIVKTKDFNWTFDANATSISNKVSLREGEEFVTGSVSGPGLNGSFVQVIRSGESLGSFLLPSANADGSVSSEKTIQGSGIPDFTYGFSSSLSYKSLDLSMNFTGVSGNKIYNNTAHFINNVGNNRTRDLINETNKIPAGVSNYFLEDGAFLRLSNLTLGYDLNVSKIKTFSKLRIYTTGQNLFTLTKYNGFDPEVNTPKTENGILSYGIDFGSYPKARSFLIGVNASF